MHLTHMDSHLLLLTSFSVLLVSVQIMNRRKERITRRNQHSRTVLFFFAPALLSRACPQEREVER